MARKTNSKACCSPTDMGVTCCKVEALVSVDERGQMVLPKETRDRANIHAGDKLAVVSWERGEKASCLTLIKAEELTDMVKSLLGPMMEDLIKK
jgi:AbrB family looped-hinge helix DNA binding protein